MLLTISDPQPAAPPPSPFNHPLWALGFRPFYLLAAAFSALAIPLWLAHWFGWMQALPNITLAWHMHEMLFGFVLAVIVGFLYTAARNWTGLWTPRRGHLAALAGLWLAGRVAMLLADPWLAALVDLAFLPCAAWPLYRVLRQAGNRRNMFMVGLLGLLALANAVFHAVALGWLGLSPMQPVHAAILVVVLLESVLGGRVIPMFTANGAPGTKPVTDARRDRIAISLTALAALAWVSGFPPRLAAAFALAAACAQALRLAGWKPHATLKHPLLWILHLSYAWIPVGFALLALASLGVVSAGAALHVLVVGSMAGLILGMMTRTALGHTGRKLKAGQAEVWMYGLIQAGAVARLAVAVGLPGQSEALMLAALCWSMAFLLYVVAYGPRLWQARLDGSEG